jgi:chitinase
MPASVVDFAALTHVIHFSVAPVSDGSLNTTLNNITPARSADLVSHAHAAGKKVLFCVSGSTLGGFGGATSTANRGTFITNLVNFMSTNGYDGIDIDWEPLVTSDALQYTNFIKELRVALNGYSPYRMLTVATAAQPAWFAMLQGQFDQINLMTYDLSGPWDGWVTWFNAPVYDGGYRFPSTGGLVPSADGMVTKFINAGVAPAKLSIGIAFYGRMWSGGTGTPTGGVSAPRQSWTTDPTMSYASYATILSTYYQTNLYHWDTAAQASYLSINNTGSTNDQFISYDDERVCQSKVVYARNRGIGGVMIWELGEAYRSSQPAGQRDPLLQAVKRALFGTQRYFDVNTATASSGVVNNGSYAWGSLWSAAADGTAATATWANGDDAVFCAGTDAAGKFFRVTGLPSAGPTVNSWTVSNCWVQVEGSAVTNVGTTGTGGTTLLAVYDSNGGFSLTNLGVCMYGSVGLTKRGPGTYNAGSTERYVGPTYLEGGTTIITPDLPTKLPFGLGAPRTTNATIHLIGGTLSGRTPIPINAANTGMAFLTNHYILSLEGGTLDAPTPATNFIIQAWVTGPGALIKTGNSLLTLTCTSNNYSGGTIVSAGTLQGAAAGSLAANVSVGSSGMLELSHASAMASSASLTLTASPGAGTANLNFSGSQTIHALYFGSALQRAGTHGGIGSGAKYESAVFTGPGLLNVTFGWTDPSLIIANNGEGNYALQCLGTAGVGYSVRASTNAAAPVSAWTVIATNIFGSSPSNYIDLAATNYPTRYYRISIP